MTQPDLDKHVKLMVGDLALKLAMANARIEQLEADNKALKEGDRKVGDES